MNCKICGARAISDYCWKHKPNYSLSRGGRIKTKKKETNIEEIDEMWNFFLSLWRKRKHVSEISGEKLQFSSLIFHHILLKSVIPQAKYDEENITIITPQEHSQIHSDMYRYDEINRRRELLIEKYNL